MHNVYIIQSESHPSQTYVGYSTNMKQRLSNHNVGYGQHTSKYRPWKLQFYAAFEEKQKALEFEAYLKSHSGKAFTSKRLI